MQEIGYSMRIKDGGKSISFERHYSYKEVASILNLSIRTIHRMVDNGRIKNSRPVKRPYILGSEIAKVASPESSYNVEPEGVMHGTR